MLYGNASQSLADALDHDGSDPGIMLGSSSELPKFTYPISEVNLPSYVKSVVEHRTTNHQFSRVSSPSIRPLSVTHQGPIGDSAWCDEERM